MNDEPVLLEALMAMNAASMELADLDGRSLMLVRLAGLAAVDAPVISYGMNLGAAADVGLTLEEVRSTLVALAPIIGTPKVVSAAAKISEVLDFALAIEEFEGI